MRITHIAPDSQFTQFLAEFFEAAMPGANEYVILTASGNGPLRYPIRYGRVRVVSSRVHGVACMPFSVRRSSMIIAHSMSPHAAFTFAVACPSTIKVWSGWGFDYYGSDESTDTGLLGPLTLELAASLREARRSGLLRSIRRRLWRGAIRRATHHAAGRTDIFSAPIPEDLEVFKSRFPGFRGGFSQLTYASVEHTFAGGADLAGGGDILIGNSASQTNNHLDVFDRISQLDLKGRRIVVPLSYGDSAYREAILARGTELFGSAFTPLVDFLPLNEYVEAVANCTVVIMGHQRQQALGNVGAALYHGAHVYMDEANPALEFFLSRGAVVFNIEKLVKNGLPSGPIPSESLTANRRMLEDYWGLDRNARNVEDLLSHLSSSKRAVPRFRAATK